MKICIDAGHGMSNVKAGRYDSGAVSGGVTEADICLAWALTAKYILTQHGFKVFLTRENHESPAPVANRAGMAKREGCTHFIAIHCNSGGMLAIGTEAYYRDAADKALGAKVLECAVSAMRTKDRGLKNESSSQHPRLAVLNFDGPACLVELGFITNPAERKRLLNRDCRIDFANGLVRIFNGIKE